MNMHHRNVTQIPINGNKPDLDFYTVIATDGTSYELAPGRRHFRKGLIVGLLTGEFEDVDRIWCGNPAMNSFQNVTEDIAREVWGARCDGWNIKGRLFDWVQANGGCSIHAEPVEW